MKIVKVKCSFCRNEIDCPENMSDAKGHICTKCFDRIGEKGIVIGQYSKNN